MTHHRICHECQEHEHTLWGELVCHVPYAALSVSLGLVLLSIINFLGLGISDPEQMHEGYHILFHSFHYLHIVVAITGTVVTFFRFSRNILVGTIVSLLVPTVFCVASDVVLPTLAGRLLGINMVMHVCFFDLHDALNLVAFMLMGFICGISLLYHRDSLKMFSLTSHFLHILISSMASTFYMVAHGFYDWYDSMGILCLFLFIAVILPCTLSDIVVPIYCARKSDKH